MSTESRVMNIVLAVLAVATLVVVTIAFVT
jgi:hypothetical protein